MSAAQNELEEKYTIEFEPQKTMKYNKQVTGFTVGLQTMRNRYTLEKLLDVDNDPIARDNLRKFCSHRVTTHLLPSSAAYCGGWVLGSLISGNSNVVPWILGAWTTLIGAIIVKENTDKFGEAIANTYNLEFGLSQVAPGKNNHIPTIGLKFNLTR